MNLRQTTYLLLFAAALAFGYLLREFDGYLQIVVEQYRLTTSLLGAALALSIVILTLYIVATTLIRLLRKTKKGAQYFRQRNDRQADKLRQQALNAYLQGDHETALKLSGKRQLEHDHQMQLIRLQSAQQLGTDIEPASMNRIKSVLNDAGLDKTEQTQNIVELIQSSEYGAALNAINDKSLADETRNGLLIQWLEQRMADAEHSNAQSLEAFWQQLPQSVTDNAHVFDWFCLQAINDGNGSAVEPIICKRIEQSGKLFGLVEKKKCEVVIAWLPIIERLNHPRNDSITRTLEQLIKRFPRTAELYRGLAFVLEHNDPTLALAALNKFFEVTAANAGIKFDHHDLGYLDGKSEPTPNKLSDLVPSHTLVLKARLLELKGSLPEAMSWYHVAVADLLASQDTNQKRA